MSEENKVSSWRTILAFFLDLIFSFLIFGYIIARFTGDTTEGGFQLNGIPAVFLFLLVVAYFIGMGRYGGGTVFQRLLRAKRN